jgi:cysteine desulfurase/selenocysteine lyase
MSAPLMVLNSISDDDFKNGIQRKDFPLLFERVHLDKELIYLDNAASTQKPVPVIEAMDKIYRKTYSNVRRGSYFLADKATEQYEQARSTIKDLICARHAEEIVITHGCTESINLVSLSYGERLQEGDEIILSVMEHHSNLVPWQLLSKRTGAILKFVKLNSNMEFDFQHFQSLLSSRTRIVAVCYVSNVLGCINPVQQIVNSAKLVSGGQAVVLIDAAQALPFLPLDVQELNVDFLVGSSHKMCGPTGVGFLYGKRTLLDSMTPIFGGSGAVDSVELESSIFSNSPFRFEAGTPPFVEAIGFAAAIQYLKNIGWKRIADHEFLLGRYMCDRLRAIPDLQICGPLPSASTVDPSIRSGIVSFRHSKIHSSDLAIFLDQEGVAVRSGNLCTQPLLKVLGSSGLLRASCYFYNHQKDIDDFVNKLEKSIGLLI